MMETLISVHGAVSRSGKPRKSGLIFKREVSWTRMSQGGVAGPHPPGWGR